MPIECGLFGKIRIFIARYNFINSQPRLYYRNFSISDLDKEDIIFSEQFYLNEDTKLIRVDVKGATFLQINSHSKKCKLIILDYIKAEINVISYLKLDFDTFDITLKVSVRKAFRGDTYTSGWYKNFFICHSCRFKIPNLPNFNTTYGKPYVHVETVD
jgi:hypothetical protein